MLIFGVHKCIICTAKHIFFRPKFLFLDTWRPLVSLRYQTRVISKSIESYCKKEMLVDKFRKLGFEIDQRIEIRESDQYGKHICATETIEKGDFGQTSSLFSGYLTTGYFGLKIKKWFEYELLKWLTKYIFRRGHSKDSGFSIHHIVKLSQRPNYQCSLWSVSTRIVL